MKYLGIDYGSKRIGVAVSDESQQMAFPVTVLSNSARVGEEIKNLVEKHTITHIVIGESLNFKQTDNDIMKEARPFAEKLEKDLGIPVSFHPEFMTSQEAEQIQGKNDMLDASAAAIILKSYLEKIKKHD